MIVKTAAFLLMMTASIVKKRWVVQPNDPPVDTLTTHNGMLFLGRSNKLQWFKPSNDKINGLQERWMPRPIQRIVVHPKSLLLNMCPETTDYVSDSMVFTRGKRLTLQWYDSTLYETIVDEDHILRSNYFGEVCFGSLKGGSGNTTLRNQFRVKSSTAMTVYESMLWCASEESTSNGPRTLIEVFNMADPSLPLVHSFYIDSTTCSHPTQISVVLQDCLPRKAVYIAVGYMRGGVHAGHAFFPPEKQFSTIRTNKVDNENPILSLCMDFPYIHTLDKHGIETLRFPSILSMPEYIGRYKMLPSDFHIISQIACIKRQVFWNGQDILHSVEISNSG